jgi:RNA polymerase sigma-70 factor (ECF subfamily)
LDQAVNIHDDLIKRCQSGDRIAYQRIYQLYSKAMFNICFRITGNDFEAEDALQEGFISAFRSIHSFRGESTFGAWLKRIVVNKAINELKKRKTEHLNEDNEIDIPDEEDTPDYRESLSVDRVRDSINALPDGYRTVLSLYLIEGYDHQEIAEILEITASTSKSQLNRAKKKLREILSQAMNTQ